MRKAILRIALAGLLAVGICITISSLTEAQVLEIRAGVSQGHFIWQTNPPPYRQTSLGAGLSLALLVKSVRLGFRVAIADLQTMRLYYPFTFAFGANIRLVQFATVFLTAGLSVSVQPAYDWISYSLGLGATMSLTRYIDVSGSIGIASTRGSRRAPSSWWWTSYYPAGWGIQVGVSVDWVLFSFPW